MARYRQPHAGTSLAQLEPHTGTSWPRYSPTQVQLSPGRAPHRYNPAQVQHHAGTAQPRYSPTQVQPSPGTNPRWFPGPSTTVLGAASAAPLQQPLWTLISVPSLMDLVNSIQQTGEGGNKCVRFSESKDFSASMPLMVCYADLDKCCFQLIDQGDLF